MHDWRFELLLNWNHSDCVINPNVHDEQWKSYKTTILKIEVLTRHFALAYFCTYITWSILDSHFPLSLVSRSFWGFLKFRFNNSIEAFFFLLLLFSQLINSQTGNYFFLWNLEVNTARIIMIIMPMMTLSSSALIIYVMVHKIKFKRTRNWGEAKIR